MIPAWKDLMKISTSDIIESMFFSAVVCGDLNYESDSYHKLSLPEKECCFINIEGDNGISLFVFSGTDSLTDLASSFIGKDNPSGEEVMETFKEMVNMISGTALGYAGDEYDFRLGLPELITYDEFEKRTPKEKRHPEIIQAKMLNGSLILVLF